MQFFTSQKGGMKLGHEGYIYVKDGKSGEKTYWRCADRSCKGRAITEGQSFIKRSREHIHAPDPAKLEVKILKL